MHVRMYVCVFVFVDKILNSEEKKSVTSKCGGAILTMAAARRGQHAFYPV